MIESDFHNHLSLLNLKIIVNPIINLILALFSCVMISFIYFYQVFIIFKFLLDITLSLKLFKKKRFYNLKGSQKLKNNYSIHQKTIT
jgi:hypothetical protein